MPIDATGWTASGPPVRMPADAPIDSVPGWTSSQPTVAPRAAAPAAPEATVRASWSAPRPGWPWPPDDASELLEQTDPTWTRAPRPAPRVVPPSFAVPMASLSTPRPDPALAAVADILDGPVLLVWSPVWAPSAYECLLHADGTLETSDGSLFGDVEALSRAITGYTGPLDAWQAWHVDSAKGPTLSQLAAELFPDQF